MSLTIFQSFLILAAKMYEVRTKITTKVHLRMENKFLYLMYYWKQSSFVIATLHTFMFHQKWYSGDSVALEIKFSKLIRCISTPHIYHRDTAV